MFMREKKTNRSHQPPGVQYNQGEAVWWTPLHINHQTSSTIREKRSGEHLSTSTTRRPVQSRRSGLVNTSPHQPPDVQYNQGEAVWWTPLHINQASSTIKEKRSGEHLSTSTTRRPVQSGRSGLVNTSPHQPGVQYNQGEAVWWTPLHINQASSIIREKQSGEHLSTSTTRSPV